LNSNFLFLFFKTKIDNPSSYITWSKMQSIYIEQHQEKPYFQVVCVHEHYTKHPEKRPIGVLEKLIIHPRKPTTLGIVR
jgi:hypothetical protein